MAIVRALFVCLLCLLVVANGANNQNDEYWQAREVESQKVADAAYNHNPEATTDHFNAAVRRDMLGNKNIKRNLMQHTGPCLATNPIDRCWRCDPNWAKNRKKLADCALGFGHGVTGGKGGSLYIVNDASDNDVVNPKPGTLRYGVIQKGSLWIIFDRAMNIELTQELVITSDKTIDGRGFNVQISYGGGLTIQNAKNVIVHGIEIHHIISKPGGIIRDSIDHSGPRHKSDGDGIAIIGSSHIWIDHVSMSHGQDGLIDATMGSNAITISNSHFSHHNKVILFGSGDNENQDTKMQATVAFNKFGKSLVQRMPRCRFGFFHVVNNDYTGWLMYAIGGTSNPTIVSQGNRYRAPDNPIFKKVTMRMLKTDEWKKWSWRSEGDLLLNGAVFESSGDQTKSNQGFSENEFIKYMPGSEVESLTRFAGRLDCMVGKPC